MMNVLKLKKIVQFPDKFKIINQDNFYVIYQIIIFQIYHQKYYKINLIFLNTFYLHL